MDQLVRVTRNTLKAVAALVVCAAAYLFGIVSGDTRIQDLTQGQWLGLILFMGSAYGITYALPFKAAPVAVTGTLTSDVTGETTTIAATLSDADQSTEVPVQSPKDQPGYHGNFSANQKDA